MEKEFGITRTHKYGDGVRDRVAIEFVLKGKDFQEVKQAVLEQFNLDDPERAMHQGIQVNDSQHSLELQSSETCNVTGGARINVLLQKDYCGTITAVITPNHHIWDSSRPGLENISRGVSSALQRFVSKNS